MNVLRRSLALLALAAPLLGASRLHAQASEIPSAQAGPTGKTPEEQGRILIDQMIAALGGRAWLDRTTIQQEGHTAAFFQGRPNPGVTDFREAHRLPGPDPNPSSGPHEAERIGFLTDKSMIFPGKKIDVVQIWLDGRGTEVTYKGATPLPKEQVADYYRRRSHSIEEVVRTWIHAPGVMIVYEGASMVERSRTDKVTVLSADNDAVTLQLDATTHLPLRRSFEWRNAQFKDHDEDAEEYDDYHPVQGLPTALTITRYRNGDMTVQRYLTKVTYNAPLAPALFDPTVLLQKK